MVKIIVNPQSGKGLKSWRHIKKRIERSGVDCDFAVTTRRKEATYLAQEAQQQGHKNIFIVGGDGTINEVVNGLYMEDVTLGVIPAGCGNDFAKMLGIKNIKDGISPILSGYKKSVDVGCMNDIYFINNLGIGLDAYVVYIKERLKKPKGRFTPLDNKYLTGFTYLFPVLKAILNFSPFQVEIESGDFKFSGQVLGISIGNGRFHGGLFPLTPQARIDDGLLDLCVIKKVNRLKAFFSLSKAVKGRHLSLREVQTHRAERFSIYSEEPFFVHSDGELSDYPLNRIEVGVLKRKLAFLLPKKAS